MKNRNWKRTTALVAAVVLAAGALGARAAFVRIRGDLARQRAAIEAGWREVNAALDERAALVRSMAEAARGVSPAAAAASSEAAESAAALTRVSSPEARIRANRRLSEALATVLLCAEKDPRLAADRTFARLADEIKDSEEHIAEARRKYNESLEHFNAHIQQFPSNMVARIAGFHRNDAYFQTEPF